MPRGTKPPVGAVTQQLAAIIRGELAKQGRQHSEIADAIGVHRNHLSRMLNGRAHIDIDQFATICQLLGVRMLDLVAEAETSSPGNTDPDVVDVARGYMRAARQDSKRRDTA